MSDCTTCKHVKEVVEGRSVVCNETPNRPFEVEWNGAKTWGCPDYREARVQAEGVVTCDDIEEPDCAQREGCAGCPADTVPLAGTRLPSPARAPAGALPSGAAERKGYPLVRGLLDYFPAALAEVAAVSKKGNDQHNPGQEMHHARGKSTDHADCIVRHLVDRGTLDSDGQRHSAKVAWRALALLQEELERDAGAPLPRGAKVEVAP